MSIAIIRLGVAKFEPLPADLFKYDFRWALQANRSTARPSWSQKNSLEFVT